MWLRKLRCARKTMSTLIAELWDKPIENIEDQLGELPLGIDGDEKDSTSLMRILVVLIRPNSFEGMSWDAVERTAVLLGQELRALRPDSLLMHMGAPSPIYLEMAHAAISASAMDIPFIITIRENSLEFERKARSAGVNYYAVTPVTAVEMEMVLGSVCAGNRNVANTFQHSTIPVSQ